MTVYQPEPSILASLRVQFWGLCFLFCTLMTYPSCLENCSINMYADDTIIYFTNLCTSERSRVVQADLHQVVQCRIKEEGLS